MLKIRILGYYIGSVRKDVWNVYSGAFKVTNLSEHAKYLIEKELLHSQISTSKDVADASCLVKNIMYRNIGEWLCEYMRNKAFPHLVLCENCQCLEEDNYCPIMACYISPLFNGCGNIVSRRPNVITTDDTEK